MSRSANWIDEVRARLAARPARHPVVAGPARGAALVGLLVDAGQLWTVLVQPAVRRGREPGAPVFPARPVGPGEEVWNAAVAAGLELAGIDLRQPIPLGELDELETPDGGLITPVVAALPTALETRPGPGAEEVFRLPLAAFANPRLVEERRVDTAAGPRLVRAVHAGPRILWGLAAHILEDLLERLGAG